MLLIAFHSKFLQDSGLKPRKWDFKSSLKLHQQVKNDRNSLPIINGNNYTKTFK